MENINRSPSDLARRWLGLSCLLGTLLLLAGAAYGYHSANCLGETAELEAIAAADIFRNNAAMLGVNLLGVLLLGLPNLVSGALNGCALGSAAAISLRQFGPRWLLRAFLPHAALELPVIVIAVALGFLPWMWITRRIRRPEEPCRPLLRALARMLLVVALVCLAMLAAAAWVEANVSMRVAL